jgi:hypothetical protein
MYHHPLCRRCHVGLFYVDLLQFLLRPDLDIYFRNKITAKTKQPIYFEPTQPNEYCIIQNKFPMCIVMFILLAFHHVHIFNTCVMSNSHVHILSIACSWTNIITTDLVIWFMKAHEQHHELQRPTETPFLTIFVSRSSWILRVVFICGFEKSRSSDAWL